VAASVVDDDISGERSLLGRSGGLDRSAVWEVTSYDSGGG
jgi:hypothetical protein